ncbi:hypothetical protein DKX15_22655, partial [Enterococcus faecium]
AELGDFCNDGSKLSALLLGLFIEVLTASSGFVALWIGEDEGLLSVSFEASAMGMTGDGVEEGPATGIAAYIACL